MATESLKVKISADINDFLSSCDKMTSEIEGISKKFEGLNKIGEGFKSVGKQMTAVGVGIVASIGGVVAKGAEWSASVESTNFLYKNLDKSVQKTIANNSKTAKSIGLTTQQYKAGATELGTYFKNLGVTAEESSKLSGSTMNLIADLGAVADVPFDDALGDFKSALMGNYEAVDKYGISLSASALENSDFVKSLGKSWNQLSENEKMMAALNEITRQGASAQGLAGQEAESFGMKFKLLKEQVAETVGTLGASLLPTLEPIVAKFSEITEKIRAWAEANPELTGKILTVVGVIGVLAATLGPLIIFIGTLITSFSAISGAITAVSGAFALLSGPVLIVIGVITALIAIGVALYQNWDTIKAKASEIWNGIKTGILNVVNALKQGLVNDLNNMKATALAAWNAIKSVASSTWNGIKSVVTSALNGIKTTASNAWNSVKNTAKNAWNTVKSTISGALSNIKSLLSGFKPSWSIPKPKLPRISVGSTTKSILGMSVPVPTFSVSWNAKGGIFNKPTIFSTPAGFQGVGERGAEAILPLNGFYNHLDDKLDSNAINYDKLARAIVKANNEAGSSIYLDGNALIGGTIERTEKYMGNRMNLAERGLIL